MIHFGVKCLFILTKKRVRTHVGPGSGSILIWEVRDCSQIINKGQQKKGNDSMVSRGYVMCGRETTNRVLPEATTLSTVVPASCAINPSTENTTNPPKTLVKQSSQATITASLSKCKRINFYKSHVGFDPDSGWSCRGLTHF